MKERERENGKVIGIGTIAQLSGGSSNDRVLDFGFKGPELKSHSLRAAQRPISIVQFPIMY